MKIRPRQLAFTIGLAILAMMVPIAATTALTVLTRQRVDFVDLLWNNKYKWIPISAGFGAQVGVFVLMKQVMRRRVHTAPGGAVATTSGGLSSLAVMACCAPATLNLLLPLLGISAAAGALSTLNMPLMIAALALNLGGIAIMLSVLLKRRQAGQSPMLPEPPHGSGIE